MIPTPASTMLPLPPTVWTREPKRGARAGEKRESAQNKRESKERTESTDPGVDKRGGPKKKKMEERRESGKTRKEKEKKKKRKEKGVECTDPGVGHLAVTADGVEAGPRRV